MKSNPSEDHPRPSISVVIPIRNEEDTIAELHARLRSSLDRDAEIIFVNDGSEDGSQRVIEDLVSEDSRSRAVRFLRPVGKSEALGAGFFRARGKVIATIDADLQERPEDIPTLKKAIDRDECDVVSGWRRQRRDPWRKVVGSRIFNALVCFFSGLRLRDMNCGLKVMRREVVQDLRLETGYHRFIPLLAHWGGYRAGEIEIEHAPRRHGRSRFGKERILHGVVDLLVLLFLERFERRPSRIFLTAGGALFSVGFFISLFIVYLKLTTGTIQSRYPLLVLAVLLLVVGLQIVATGFLAELLAHRRRDALGGPRALDLRSTADQAPREEPVDGRFEQSGKG